MLRELQATPPMPSSPVELILEYSNTELDKRHMCQRALGGSFEGLLSNENVVEECMQAFAYHSSSLLGCWVSRIVHFS